MIALLITLAPIIIPIVNIFLTIFTTSRQGALDRKKALQDWYNLKKSDYLKSVSQHASDQQQEDDLGKEGVAPKP